MLQMALHSLCHIPTKLKLQEAISLNFPDNWKKKRSTAHHQRKFAKEDPPRTDRKFPNLLPIYYPIGIHYPVSLVPHLLTVHVLNLIWQRG
jgi:hypothetical protein